MRKGKEEKKRKARSTKRFKFPQRMLFTSYNILLLYFTLKIGKQPKIKKQNIFSAIKLVFSHLDGMIKTVEEIDDCYGRKLSQYVNLICVIIIIWVQSEYLIQLILT